LHILMNGSIVSAAEGDAEAAQRARSMARLLIRQYRVCGGTRRSMRGNP
jgi:hypothetical protein